MVARNEPQRVFVRLHLAPRDEHAITVARPVADLHGTDEPLHVLPDPGAENCRDELEHELAGRPEVGRQLDGLDVGLVLQKPRERPQRLRVRSGHHELRERLASGNALRLADRCRGRRDGPHFVHGCHEFGIGVDGQLVGGRPVIEMD